MVHGLSPEFWQDMAGRACPPRYPALPAPPHSRMSETHPTFLLALVQSYRTSKASKSLIFERPGKQGKRKENDHFGFSSCRFAELNRGLLRSVGPPYLRPNLGIRLSWTKNTGIFNTWSACPDFGQGFWR